VYFTSFGGVLFFFRSILGSFVWPILFAIVISSVIKKSNLVIVYLLLLIASSPLYIVAHDWGRFAIYSLLLSILIASLDCSVNKFSRLYFFNKLAYKLEAFSYTYSGIKILYIFPLLYHASPNYRVGGLEDYNLFLVILFLTFFFTHSKNTNPHIKSERSK
jgi:hypothetical protein